MCQAEEGEFPRTATERGHDHSEELSCDRAAILRVWCEGNEKHAPRRQETEGENAYRIWYLLDVVWCDELCQERGEDVG